MKFQRTSKTRLASPSEFREIVSNRPEISSKEAHAFADRQLRERLKRVMAEGRLEIELERANERMMENGRFGPKGKMVYHKTGWQKLLEAEKAKLVE